MTNLQRLIGLSPAKHIISTSTDKNAHVLITGISGSGKTYLNFNLILQDYVKDYSHFCFTKVAHNQWCLTTPL
jgi:excinuclease UvrABC ATPase subunit